MGTLVQMAKESKSMLLENSVSYLSIGYTVVLDSTDQEAKVEELIQENISLELMLAALQEDADLYSQNIELQQVKMAPEEQRELKRSKQELLPLRPYISRSSPPKSCSEVTLKGLNPEGLRYLIEYQMMDGIDSMHDATPDQLEAIFQGLKSNISLERLDIPFISSPVNISTLSASLTVNNTLQDLTMSCILDDHAIELLSAALQVNRSLNKVSLHWTVTDTGAQHLATMLTANTTLQHLGLSSLISDDGVLYLSEALKLNSSLKELYLPYNERITNTGAVALGEMLLVNQSLETLDLYGTSVGKEGAAALMESLLHNQVLTRLILPWECEFYYKQHQLPGSVKNRLIIVSDDGSDIID